MLHVDFSENYNCKYSEEIQSVHFGGAGQQITRHTAVLYRKQNYVLTTVHFAPLYNKRDGSNKQQLL